MKTLIINIGDEEKRIIKVEAASKGLSIKDLLLGVFFSYYKNDEDIKSNIVKNIKVKLESGRKNTHL